MRALGTEDGYLVSDADGEIARWAEYFEHLFMVDPPSGELQTARLETLHANRPIVETAPSIDNKETVAKLTGGKSSGIYNISAELLKAGGEIMIHGLHAALTAV